jgi:phenylacetate-coenzyme A ligase PaaK-like adenylate-forming protein
MQRRRLAGLLEIAARSSPFYRQRWGGRAPRPEDLHELEPVTKAQLFDRHFDEALTDRSLNKEILRRSLGAGGRRPYIVIATSGTTGEPVIMPYSRREWIEGLARMLRAESWRSSGLFHSLRRARRLAAVATQNPIHASAQLASSLCTLPGRSLTLAAAMPLEEQIRRLEAYQPTMLWGYPSAIDRLARAQLEGRLSIRPQAVVTGGETVTGGMRERVRAGWNGEVFDSYGLTEALVFAWECREHRGMHIDEDAVILEVVDDEDHVLPRGESGKAVLVTNLFNRTLPVFRYRVGDMMAISEEPCPCGLPFARITSIEGRRDELLRLRGAGGEVVEVHPMAIETPLEEMPEVRRFQIRRLEGAVHVVVVPREAREDLARRIREALLENLAAYRVAPESVGVEIAGAIDQEFGATDKRRRVVRP